jgi:sec-independent protein translocase protein TatA
MFGLGIQELLIILLVVLLLFGAKRIPEVMRSFGKGVTEFKKGVKDIETEFDKVPPETETKTEEKQDTEQKKT